MTYTGLHNDQYTTGREIGRGGEGAVYELRSHSGLVLKKYNDTLTADKIAKLRLMVAMRSPGIEAYAAWPADIVRDDTGFICGFVMKKLTGFVPLHMVFSPMDRKNMFPDKGYNFLVHVARNLATAFYKLYEAGLVVGDVNEGNILISASGLVGFIDCDSFQVKGENNYYYCEVGVPRYTPPELLKKGSFENIVRTVNTDSFSLAVLIFQLLFLGRHPFAGKNKSARDIDEETAIRLHYFAYSLDSQKKKLSPPVDSFDIRNLSEDLISQFHLAFEQDIARPLPADWVKSLDSFLSSLVTCAQSRLHSYPSKMEECPWCYFRKTRGIMFFLDDSYLHASAVLGDIESFVNGFRIEKLELKKWDDPPSIQLPEPTAIDKQWLSYNKLRKRTTLALAIISVTLIPLYAWFTQLFFITPVLAIVASFVFRRSPWVKKLKTELERRKQLYFALNSRTVQLITEFNSPSDLPTYNKGLDTLQRLVHDFRRLPDEYERRKKIVEEELYNEQLNDYLTQFYLDAHAIPSIGPAKKSAMLNAGIRNAADIPKLYLTKVPGIGPGNLQILLDWRRQMSTGFVYIPVDHQIAQRLQKVNEDVAKIKLQLESNIRQEYQTVNFLKLNITNRANILEAQIRDLSQKTLQAKVDMEAFRKLAA